MEIEHTSNNAAGHEYILLKDLSIHKQVEGKIEDMSLKFKPANDTAPLKEVKWKQSGDKSANLKGFLARDVSTANGWKGSGGLC